LIGLKVRNGIAKSLPVTKNAFHYLPGSRNGSPSMPLRPNVRRRYWAKTKTPAPLIEAQIFRY
jgi:hypothetical protein